MTHICVGKLTIIGSDNGLSPGRRQAIIWTNAGILLLWTIGTNFSQFVIEIQTFSLKQIRLKMSSAKCCPFRLSLNVLIYAMPILAQHTDFWLMQQTLNKVLLVISWNNGIQFYVFKWNFLNEKFYILIQITLKFVPEVCIDCKSSLVKIMASVAYRYRKSISIIELFVSIYIDIYRVLSN